MQYHLHRQLSLARDYAHSRGVFLKGDLPIGISPTSTDAWASPELFHLDSQAGAPPDAFAVKGQNWGLPTYNWERMAQDGFAWWKARMKNMEQYFDAFRIDHILGFFRIWEIPAGASSGLLGHFNPALPYTTEYLRSLSACLIQALPSRIRRMCFSWQTRAARACGIPGSQHRAQEPTMLWTST